MQRLRRALLPLAALVSIAGVAVIVVGDSAADLDNASFTSRTERLRLVVPRGWRASEQPSYPGVLLWMGMPRGAPQGQIVLTGEAFTRELYCAWPPACRTGHDGPAGMYACALRTKLAEQRMKVGPIQAGPKDNDLAGVPSVWFDYDDGKHFLRQAVAFSGDRAISLVLSTPTSEARATHVRAFEQALRTLRPLNAEETARVEARAAANAASPPPGDAGIRDATPPSDGPLLDAGAAFESAPAPRIDPIGPCPK
jgi:hypothetical protein